MAAKHTPAPWVADDFCMENDRRVRVGTTDGTKTYYHSTATVCECWVGESEDLIDGNGRRIGTVEAEANARLIAAAPDLLAALKLALPVLLTTDEDTAPRLQERIAAVQSALAKAEG